MFSNNKYYTADGKYKDAEKGLRMSFFMNHPVFKGYKHMFINVEDNILRLLSFYKYEDALKKMDAGEQIDIALDAFNYLIHQSEINKVSLIDKMYPDDEIRKDKYKSRLTGIFYHGEKNKPLAIVVPGGGFISNCTAYEAYPVAMRLHQLGYSVLAVSYPVGKQLGETDHFKQGQQACERFVQVIRYLQNHQEQLNISLDDYAIFGFSAGGMIATSYSFAMYKDSCHNHGLPRPKVIFPLYGLDWNIEPQEKDKGLAVFEIVGRKDEFGFGEIEKKIPALKEILGEENVSITIYDDLGHGFGLGEDTVVKNWLENAVAFWEEHR